MNVVTLPRVVRPAVAPFRAGSLFTDKMAVKAEARRWLAPDATRLAICFWWPIHNLRDARVELRLSLLRAIREDCLTPEWRAFSDEVLGAAIVDVWAMHQQTAVTVASAVTNALRAGREQAAVVEVAVAIARRSTPLPPPWLVRETIDAAAKEHRFATKFWQRARPIAKPGGPDAAR